jgi:hypothetical protein
MVCSFFEGVDLAVIKHMINRVQKRPTTVLYGGYEFDLRGIQVRVAQKFCTREDAMKRTSKFIWGCQHYTAAAICFAYAKYC